MAIEEVANYVTSDGTIFEDKRDAELYEEAKELAITFRKRLSMNWTDVLITTCERYNNGADYIQHHPELLKSVEKPLFTFFQSNVGIITVENDDVFEDVWPDRRRSILQFMKQAVQENTHAGDVFGAFRSLIKQLLRIDSEGREWAQQQYLRNSMSGIENPKNDRYRNTGDFA